jgi:hypothetical protein
VLHVGVLVLLALEVPAGCAPEASEAAREEARLLLEAGQQQLAAGEWSRGEDSLRGAIRLDPASPYAHYALGLAHVGRQAHADAVAAFTGCREALRCLREGSPEARERFLGRIDHQIQALRTAVAELERQRLKEHAIPGQDANRGSPRSS